jgi:hypothetical protein
MVGGDSDKIRATDAIENFFLKNTRFVEDNYTAQTDTPTHADKSRC